MIMIEPPKSLDEMEKIWNEATKEMRWDEVDNGYYTSYLYVDYRDREIGKDTLKRIFGQHDPKEAFYDELREWEFDARQYDEDEYEKDLKRSLSEEDREITEDWYSQEFEEWQREHIYFCYDPDDFNTTYKVNIVIDAGDANYDFGCNSILNWYGLQNSECDIDEHSSIMWLAKQQGKYDEVQKEIKYVFENRERQSKDPFVKSVITELENLPQYCGMLTFLVEMNLLDLIKLKREINEKKQGQIVISKDTMCGLFESWNGGGSVLEIELDKDVVVPYEMIYDAWIDGTKPHGYDVDEVYGLVSSAWHGEVKMETEAA